MKKILLIMVVFAFVSCQSGKKNANDSEVKTIETTEVATATFSISGMHCENCVASVEKGINSLEGIATVAVSLNDSNAVVEYNAAKLSEKDIKEAIEKRGYTVKN